MRARVTVSLKQGVLDPQGKAVGDALHRLGFDEVADVRVGKVIELELPDATSKSEAETRVRKMCENLLANTVIERFSIDLTD